MKTVLFLLLLTTLSLYASEARTVVVMVKDQNGNPVSGVKFIFKAEVKWKYFNGDSCTIDEGKVIGCYSDYGKSSGTTKKDGVGSTDIHFQDMSNQGYSGLQTTAMWVQIEAPKNYQISGEKEIYTEDPKADTLYATFNITPESESHRSLLASATTLLNNDQRRAFLHFYSPIILKRAEEGTKNNIPQRGWDWITNFYFDHQSGQNSGSWSDDYLRDNGDNWKAALQYYTTNPLWGRLMTDWDIRPTIYTSIMEFVENDANGIPRKCLMLLYHPYQAIDKDGKIHDWEYIGIRIDGVNGGPGSGEQISYVVITTHKVQNALKLSDPQLNFYNVSDGKHVLIWRAQWDGASGTDDLNGGELQFVKDTNVLNLNDNDSAKVNVFDPYANATSGTGNHYVNFHYIFVNEKSNGASERWNSACIDPFNAYYLSSGKNKYEGIVIRDVKRIAYELQDIADIIPTMDHDYDWQKKEEPGFNWDYEIYDFDDR